MIAVLAGTSMEAEMWLRRKCDIPLAQFVVVTPSSDISQLNSVVLTGFVTVGTFRNYAVIPIIERVLDRIRTTEVP